MGFVARVRDDADGGDARDGGDGDVGARTRGIRVVDVVRRARRRGDVERRPGEERVRRRRGRGHEGV